MTGAAFFKLYNKYDWFFGDDEERVERIALSFAKAEVLRMRKVPWVVNVRQNVEPHDVAMLGDPEFGDNESPTSFHVRKNKIHKIWKS